jgi:uncharacterized protein (TIGR00730 family)
MKQICVFCGSSMGASSQYKEGAQKLGRTLAQSNISLVYGGASVGIMGVIAESVLESGGEVIGVIPKTLQEREIAHPSLSELHVVNSMHERKALMSDLADGFIALPGGPGTLEEFFEVFTWAQLGEHGKPCGLLNINNYYAPLMSLFDHMTEQQFLHEEYRSMVITESESEELLKKFSNYEPPKVTKWIDKSET